MRESKENIDQLFKEAFDTYEPKVSDQLWSKVSENISSSSITSTAGTMATWKIVAIAITCGIVGASVFWAYLELNSDLKKDQETEQNSIVSEELSSKKIPLKEVVFTENYPIDEQDPLVKVISEGDKEFNVVINEENIEEKNEKDQYQPSSIVNLFLTPRTKVLNHENTDNKQQESHQTAPTQIAITEVEKDKLNPKIMASVSGGYLPLVVSFQQTESAEEVTWNFGDGTVSTGNYVEHIFREANDYSVQVVIRHEDGREASATKNISVKARCIIYNVPNIFTPNGDGENDLFYVQGENIKDYFIQIFNIEGKVVFETDYLDAKWDGNDALGQQLDNGQYLYFIKAIGEDGSDLSRTGTLTLKR